MATDPQNEAPVECKWKEEEGKKPYYARRAEILTEFDKCLMRNQQCNDRASPLHGTVLFGKLQLMAMESRSLLKDTLVVLNPCNYFRREYRAQDWRKASGFYDEVKSVQFNHPFCKIEDFTLRHFENGVCQHCLADAEGESEKARFIHILKGCEAFAGGDPSAALWNVDI